MPEKQNQKFDTRFRTASAPRKRSDDERHAVVPKQGTRICSGILQDLGFQFGTLINIASTFPWHPPNQTKWAGRCIPPCRIGSCTRTPPNLRMTSHWGASVLPNRSALLTTCFGDQTCYPLHPMGLAGRQFFALPPVCPLPAPALTPADRAEGLIRLPRAHLLSLIEP